MKQKNEDYKRELAFYNPSIRSFITGHESWFMGNYVRFLRLSEKYDKSKGAKKILEFIFKRMMRHYSRKTGFQIELHCVKPGIRIYHWGPIVINGNAQIGYNFTVFPRTTIGRIENSYPTIGDNVTMCFGSAVCGNVHVGNNSVIAPNAVVTKDVPDNAIVGGVPAKIIKYKNTNQFEGVGK